MAVGIIARLSWLRLLRGKSKWLSLILVSLPVLLIAAVVTFSGDYDEGMFGGPSLLLVQLAAPLAAAAHLAGSVGEELELKTFSYLWSRPPPRWTLLAGKLVATVPALIVLFALASLAMWGIGRAGGLDLGIGDLAGLVAASTGAVVAGAALAVGAGALFPKYPLAFVLGFGLVLDKLLTLIPAVQPLSAALSAAALADLPFPGNVVMPSHAEAVVRLVFNSAFWLGIGVWRVQTTEYELPDS